MTITDFLLARIAEDEELARHVGADAMTGARWKSYPREAYEELQDETLAYCRRLRAECEAKRRIVETANDMRWHGGAVRDVLLETLATVYADHPDFREEWRA